MSKKLLVSNDDMINSLNYFPIYSFNLITRMATQIISRLKRLDALIAAKRTGTPKQLAEKLGLSERTVRNYITTLKELGAPIHYDRKRQSYCYIEDGRFRFTFETLQHKLPMLA